MTIESGASLCAPTVSDLYDGTFSHYKIVPKFRDRVKPCSFFFRGDYLFDVQCSPEYPLGFICEEGG
ncbi:MAG: hypothetical protein RIC07_17605 [Coleofasciculus sp. E1-EBD-02]